MKKARSYILSRLVCDGHMKVRSVAIRRWEIKGKRIKSAETVSGDVYVVLRVIFKLKSWIKSGFKEKAREVLRGSRIYGPLNKKMILQRSVKRVVHFETNYNIRILPIPVRLGKWMAWRRTREAEVSEWSANTKNTDPWPTGKIYCKPTYTTYKNLSLRISS